MSLSHPEPQVPVRGARWLLVAVEKREGHWPMTYVPSCPLHLQRRVWWPRTTGRTVVPQESRPASAKPEAAASTTLLAASPGASNPWLWTTLLTVWPGWLRGV